MLKSINSRIGLLSYLSKNNLIDWSFYLPKYELIGMTIKWEQAYLKRYSQKEYSGLGEIVDYGCWLGSSTIPLAMGIKSNQRVKEKDKRIYAYDIFIWQSWMDGLVSNTPVAGKFRP